LHPFDPTTLLVTLTSNESTTLPSTLQRNLWWLGLEKEELMVVKAREGGIDGDKG
jgi:hypothetical protein